MQMKVLVCNTKRKSVGKWVILPTAESTIDKAIEEVCSRPGDTCFIKKYTTSSGIKVSEDYDLYDLNEIIRDISISGTNKAIKAITETYSDDPEDVLRILKRRRYKFFPNKSLLDVAYKLADTKSYKNYRLLNGEVDDMAIINDLERLGYEATSTGVILLLES